VQVEREQQEQSGENLSPADDAGHGFAVHGVRREEHAGNNRHGTLVQERLNQRHHHDTEDGVHQDIDDMKGRCIEPRDGVVQRVRGNGQRTVQVGRCPDVRVPVVGHEDRPQARLPVDTRIAQDEFVVKDETAGDTVDVHDDRSQCDQQGRTEEARGVDALVGYRRGAPHPATRLSAGLGSLECRALGLEVRSLRLRLGHLRHSP
jgi:hypothetical protein